MSQVAILARVTVKKGKTGQYLAALAPLLEQARAEPGTLLYAVHRSADDPDVFWTTEIYADDDAFAAHRATEVHAAAEPVFTELIAAADVTIGETVMATGLDRLSGHGVEDADKRTSPTVTADQPLTSYTHSRTPI